MKKTKTPPKTYTIFRLNWEGLHDDCLREGLTEAEAIEAVAEWTATQWFVDDERLVSCAFDETRVDIFVIEEPIIEFDEARIEAARKKFEERNLATAERKRELASGKTG